MMLDEAMLTMLFITLLAFGAYVCVHNYERNLARKAGPWIATILGSDEADRRNTR